MIHECLLLLLLEGGVTALPREPPFLCVDTPGIATLRGPPFAPPPHPRDFACGPCLLGAARVRGEQRPSPCWTPLHLSSASPEPLAMLKPFFTSSRKFLDLAAADLDGNTPLHLLCRFGGTHPAALDADFGLGLPLHGGPRGARSYSRGRSRSESRSVGRLGASPARQYPPSANRARARSRSRTRLESASHSRGRSSLRGGSVEPGASDEGLARGHPVLRALQLLLSHGSDPNAANFKGQRPLHLLLANRFLQVTSCAQRETCQNMCLRACACLRVEGGGGGGGGGGGRAATSTARNR